MLSPEYPISVRQSKVHINGGLMVELAIPIMNSNVVYVANYLRNVRQTSDARGENEW